MHLEKGSTEFHLWDFETVQRALSLEFKVQV